MTFTAKDRVLCNGQPGTVIHVIPARNRPTNETLYALRLDNGRPVEARPQELAPCDEPAPAPELRPITRDQLHGQVCRVYTRLMGRLVADRMWDVLAIIEAYGPLAPSPTQVCGAVEPNQSLADAALCDLPVDHEELWHEGYAHGPAAQSRPGRYRWATITPEDLREILRADGPLRAAKGMTQET